LKHGQLWIDSARRSQRHEAHRRIEALRAKLVVPLKGAGRLRPVRAVEVLEHIGTSEAIALLEALATGAAEARLTEEARGAVGRLRKAAAR
jgi:hypothetical protein